LSTSFYERKDVILKKCTTSPKASQASQSLSCRAESVLHALVSQPQNTTNKKDTDTHPRARAAMKEAGGQGRPLWHLLTYQWHVTISSQAVYLTNTF